jgi:very-short-patch-repair endonuclease
MKKCLRRGLPKREYRDGPVGRQREGTRLQRRLGRILEEMGVSVIEEYAVGRYQLDFFCAEYWVAFEADGPIHGRRLNRDRLRDAERAIQRDPRQGGHHAVRA